MWHKGTTNGPADIAGVRVGHASDHKAKTGTSVVVFDSPATASVYVLGQAPGTRETELLDPSRTVEKIDALVLSGGSAFGLAGAEPVVEELAKAGRGFQAGPARVPIVPAAILFDLANDGKKPDDLQALYRELGSTAFKTADTSHAIGTVGAGTGATTGACKGGLGSASSVFGDDAPEPLRGRTIAALVAVNAIGSPYIGDGPHFRAAPFELDNEFGGLGMPEKPKNPTPQMKMLAQPGQNTTIGAIITDIALNKRACHSLAIAGQDGIANAIYPAHTSLDGDLVFATSVSEDPLMDDPVLLALVQACATATMARAIARGVHAATRPFQG
ncbi:MAG: P1 family peptidase [Hyphomicrobiales bacterium]